MWCAILVSSIRYGKKDQLLEMIGTQLHILLHNSTIQSPKPIFIHWNHSFLNKQSIILIYIDLNYIDTQLYSLLSHSLLNQTSNRQTCVTQTPTGQLVGLSHQVLTNHKTLLSFEQSRRIQPSSSDQSQDISQFGTIKKNSAIKF